ncbi:5089_t:CDS:1 [Acaulospora colombiana]|uniref:5089_t:CDS:1 n=1 Tax=Acaulospora colombiana TaxID=27376 RepID=A0ACA9NS30_9GLOM|nr:5089_t:CDS:1 [Acaulospora colombiana]
MTTTNIPSFLSDAHNLDHTTLSSKFHTIEIEEVERCRRANDAKNEFSVSVALRDDSMKFNRYSDILPFNYNRVKLIKRRPNKTDYINASYIEGPDKITQYIATQGPTEKTIDDFWLMVWEQNSYVIVMLTKEQEKGYTKCVKYWPEEVKQSMLFGDTCLRIELESEELVPNATCVVRTIKIEKLENSQVIELRKITQLHFVGWPDHGVPDSPDTILNLVNKTNEIQRQYIVDIVNSQVPPGKVGPIIVHCSAGCGRTGTFCTVDTALAMLPNFKDDNTDLISSLVGHFRTQRRTMVQTLTQFQYCYLAVLSKLVTNR